MLRSLLPGAKRLHAIAVAERIRQAVMQRCRVVGEEVVELTVSLGADKKPVASSVQLAGSNGDAGPTRQAYEAARRAILRCGATGFPLPDAKYETWKDLRLVFDSQGIGL